MRKILLFVFSLFIAFQTFTSCKTAVADDSKGLIISGNITPKPKATTRIKIKYQLIPTGATTEKQSDADGSFTITGVQPSTTVTFSYDGYEDATCTPKTNADCKAIKLQKDTNKTDTITVTGTILDNTEKPVSGAQIVVIDKNGTITKNTDKSDKKGQFKLKKVPKDAKIQVSADYYHQQTLDVSENITIKLQQNTVTKPNDPCKSTNGTGTWQKVKGGGNLKCVITNCNATEGKTLKVNADKTDCEEVGTNEPKTETEPDEEKVEKAKQSQQEYELAREKEKAGRVNAGLSTLATGLGGYAAVSSYFEQEADKKAEADMNEYLKGMSCNYSGGGVASLGETVEIPGGDELFDYYNQYRNLANSLKQTKAALNLTPGLEAQVVYENSNLYQYSSRTPRSGNTVSLARALMDENSEDAAAWAAQKEKTAKDLRTGALVAAGGLAFGISNLIALDTKYNKRFEKLREDFKKANEKFAAAHDGVEVEELETRITNLETLLETQNQTIANQNETITNLTTQLANINPATAEVSEITFHDQAISFATGKSELDANGKALLENYATSTIIPILNSNTETTLNITITGHTDKTGDPTTNQALSLKRATSVQTELNSLLSAYSNYTITSEGNGQKECGADGSQPDCRKIVITITANVPEGGE